MTYAVGSSFRGASCVECVCKLGGVTDCQPAKECSCAPNLVPKLSDNCDCTCLPCPNGTQICLTSKLCLALEKWCDGLQDCPDDERNCKVKEPIVLTTVEPTVGTTEISTLGVTQPTTVTTAKPVECPKVECPPGYFVHYVTTQRRQKNVYSRYYRGADGYTKGGYSKGGYSKGGYSKGGYSKGGYSEGGYSKSGNSSSPLPPPPPPPPPPTHGPECRQFKCIPDLPPLEPDAPPPPCTPPQCPPTYQLKLDNVPLQHNQCPQYICVPPPERYAYCNMTGRTFNTFDGAEYKLDVCYHTLARDARFDAWRVLVRKMCTIDGCVNHLLIRQDTDVILIKPSLRIQYNQYEYTVEQTSKICFQKNNFDVGKIGNGLAIKSRKYDFGVLYTTDGNVKVVVNTKSMYTVDGLCGYYDGDSATERRKPDGAYAASVEEFAQGWAEPGLRSDACEIKIIPPEKQKRAWDLCEVIIKEPISRCNKVLNVDKWRSICLEKVCECADLITNGTRRSDEQCLCLFLDTLIAQCLAADNHVDLGDWRMQMDCPADCPPPLIHYDCYRRGCEPACRSLAGAGGGAGAEGDCPAAAGHCFPGCYCPEGKLRKGDKCVSPQDCLDCSCNGVGTPAKYVTFEGDDIPYLGNCTYLASRDRNEVYATNGPCEDNSKATCAKSIHLIYEKNIVRVARDDVTKKLITTVNNQPVFKTLSNDWLLVSQTNGQDVTLTLPDAHVEVKVLQAKMEFTVKVPSYLYTNRTEGVCGVCAGDAALLLTSNGTLTADYEEFGKSWQATAPVLQSLDLPPQAQCGVTSSPPECTKPPPELNPCYQLLNADKFGACHLLLDPPPYVSECEEELCARNSTDACAALERYAGACRRAGVCLEYRPAHCPYTCEAPFVYTACMACEATCDNHEELQSRGCDAQGLVEGCYCPHGKVRVNNTCIEPSKCFPCDADKTHYAGDQWQEDACTTCTCSKQSADGSARVSCVTQACVSPVCPPDQQLLTKVKPGACCPEYICVPIKSEAQCAEPKKMECGYGQVLRQKTTAQGCTQFSCECKPASECEHVPSSSEVELLEPGMRRAVDASGCCPRALLVCDPAACPAPPTCPHLHTLVENNVTKCCPIYDCEAPKDKCIVSLEWEASPKGGEKLREQPQVLLKDLESTWKDGPCRSCSCERSPLGPSTRCSTTDCPPIVSTEHAVLRPRVSPFRCCPEPEYVACRDGNKVYQVNETWTSAEDVCSSFQCVETEHGRLEKVTTVQTCHTDCDLGWEYAPAEGTCCGACVARACVCGGAEHAVGAHWDSPDGCTHYTCQLTNGTIQVHMSNKTCPEPSVEMKKEFVLQEEVVPGQCCKVYTPIACRVGDQIYQEGQTWRSADPCRNVSCARAAGRHALAHTELVETCAWDCRPGWRYQEPPKGVCCGHCVQDACIVDDKFYKPDSAWQSPDNCTTYKCERDGDTLQVSASRRACPDVSACAPQHLVNETCCPVCKEAESSTCVPTPLGIESVGAIRLLHHARGLCVNTDPVPEFRECRGSCHSGTRYNNQTGSHDSKCECCQSLQYGRVVVELTCEDGGRYSHQVATPTRCGCRACGAGGAGGGWPEQNTWASQTEVTDEVPEIYMRFGSTRKPRL